MALEGIILIKLLHLRDNSILLAGVTILTVKFDGIVVVSGYFKTKFELWACLVKFNLGLAVHTEHFMLFKGSFLKPFLSLFAKEVIIFGIDGTRYRVVSCYDI